MHDVAKVIKGHYPDATIIAVTKRKRLVVEADEYVLSNGKYVYATPLGIIRKKDGTAYESA